MRTHHATSPGPRGIVEYLLSTHLGDVLFSYSCSLNQKLPYFPVIWWVPTPYVANGPRTHHFLCSPISLEAGSMCTAQPFGKFIPLSCACLGLASVCTPTHLKIIYICVQLYTQYLDEMPLKFGPGRVRLGYQFLTKILETFRELCSTWPWHSMLYMCCVCRILMSSGYVKCAMR